MGKKKYGVYGNRKMWQQMEQINSNECKYCEIIQDVNHKGFYVTETLALIHTEWILMHNSLFRYNFER